MKKKRTTKKPVIKKRDKVVVSKSPACPRCGEAVSIELERSYYGGKRYYRCWSEDCKSSNVNQGKGRRFIVMPSGDNVKQMREKRRKTT